MNRLKILHENRLFHILLFVALIFTIFGNTLSFNFVWDDTKYLLPIAAYQTFDLKTILLSPANGVEYLPIRDLSYAIDFLLWGQNPTGFHLSNIILYCMNAIFIYLMTYRLVPLLQTAHQQGGSTERNIALITTILFISHPIHSEAVSFITCRNVLLSGLFFFASCYFYLRSIQSPTNDSIRYTILSFICCVLALLSKGTAIILPFTLLLITLFHRLNVRSIVSLLPFFAVSVGIFFLFVSIAQNTGIIPDGHLIIFGAQDFISTLAVSLQIPFFYISKIFWPLNFSVEYDIDFIRNISHPIIYAVIIITTLIIALSIKFRIKHKILIFCIGWFLITLLPVLNFFLTHPVVADRYVYLSSYAPLLLVAFTLSKILQKKPIKPVVTIITFIVISCALLSFNRNSVWASDETLWSATTKTSPNALKAHLNLGRIYFNKKDYSNAFTAFDHAETIDPSSIAPAYYRALQQYNSGDAMGAIRTLEPAIAIKQDTYNARRLLADAHSMTGNNKKALQHYLKATVTPDFNDIKDKEYVQNKIQQLQSQLEYSLQPLQKAVAKNPNDIGAKLRLSLALDNIGKYRQAIALYEELENAGIKEWALYFNIANASSKIDDNKKAETYFLKAIEHKQSDPDSYNNLGLIYKKRGQYKSAIEVFKKAIQADDTFAYAYFNLAATYFHLGDMENALHYFTLIKERFPALEKLIGKYMNKISKQQ